MRHEHSLWEFDARELDREAHAVCRHHLDECIECRDALDAVRVARQLLREARGPVPGVDFQKLDEAIAAEVSRRSVSRGWRWQPFTAFTSLAVVAMVAAVFWPSSRSEVAAAEPPAIGVPLVRTVTVEAPQSLMADGSAPLLARLVDGSELLLSASSQVEAVATSADEVELAMTKGRVVVQAAHRPRKRFVVHGAGFDVLVVGTVFSVDEAGVTVAEGAVRVVPKNAGPSVIVRAGQRAAFDGRGRLMVGPELSALLAELEAARLAAPAPSAPLAAAEVPATGGRLPRLGAGQGAVRAGSVPSQVKVPGTTWPSVTGDARPPPMLEDPPVLVVPQLAPEAPTPVAVPAPVAPLAEEWAAMPAPAPPESASLPAPPKEEAVAPSPTPRAATAGLKPKDLEQIFLERAEAALAQGSCERFMLGLEEIAQDPERPERAGLARVLRARCFETQLRPRQALNEYRHYLEQFPRGPFSSEARSALP